MGCGAERKGRQLESRTPLHEPFAAQREAQVEVRAGNLAAAQQTLPSLAHTAQPEEDLLRVGVLEDVEPCAVRNARQRGLGARARQRSIYTVLVLLWVWGCRQGLIWPPPRAAWRPGEPEPPDARLMREACRVHPRAREGHVDKHCPHQHHQHHPARPHSLLYPPLTFSRVASSSADCLGAAAVAMAAPQLVLPVEEAARRALFCRSFALASLRFRSIVSDMSADICRDIVRRSGGGRRLRLLVAAGARAGGL